MGIFAPMLNARLLILLSLGSALLEGASHAQDQPSADKVKREATEKSTSEAARASVKLVWLDRVLGQLGMKHPEDKDLLRLEGGESVPGVFHGSALKIGDQEIKQDQIAAVLGGQGTRMSRVLMRDGRVLRGRLEWQSARFESESLGLITLKADSPGLIIMHRSKSDGVMPAKPAAWMADSRDGQVLPVMELPSSPLNLRWLGGVKSVAWQEVVGVCALPAPALESEVVLKDGSRWRGWIRRDAPAGMPASYWARDMTALLALLEGVHAEPVVLSQPSLSLQDGSVIVGEAVGNNLRWHRQADDMEIRITDVAAVKRLPGSDDGALPVFELSLKNGTKLTGHPHDSEFRWRHGAETLRLSWAWIQHIQISPQEAVKKS
jgi:hypothetical protein